MFSILFIYFIGKRFYDLAEAYKQNKWAYAVLGILIYFAAGFILGLGLGVLDLFFDWQIDWDRNSILKVISIVIGVLAVWGFHVFLKKRWAGLQLPIEDDIDAIGKT